MEMKKQLLQRLKISVKALQLKTLPKKLLSLLMSQVEKQLEEI